MRLDKYLKVSRLVKRRTVANEACDAGRVMINGKTAKASAEVKVGDVIEIGFGNRSVKADRLWKPQREGGGSGCSGCCPEGGCTGAVPVSVSRRICFVWSSIFESSIARDMIAVITRRQQGASGDQQGPTSGRLGVETSAISGYDRTTIDRMRLMRIGEESGLPGPVWGGRRGGLIRG